MEESLRTIKRYKGHDVVFLNMSFPEVNLIKDYVNAYVLLKKPLTKKEAQKVEGAGATFGYLKGARIIGVDTAHFYNEEMTIEEKEADAFRQIKECLKVVE